MKWSSAIRSPQSDRRYGGGFPSRPTNRKADGVLICPGRPTNSPRSYRRSYRRQLIKLKGKPLAGERVSFIPRGATLKPGMDERYERATDEKGEASFEPTERL